MKLIVAIFNKVFFYGFLLAGLTLFFFNHDAILMLTFFGTFFSSWFLSWIFKQREIDKAGIYILLVNIALWMNILGIEWGYYFGPLYYDKALHFLIGMLITAIVYAYYFKHLKIKKDAIFFTVLGMLALWEIYEYVFMVFFNFHLMGVIHNGVVLQSPIDDTMIDLICGSFGSLIYLFLKGDIKSIPKNKFFLKRYKN